MATRKQRKRRDKTFRHEYETVLIDAEGNETTVEPTPRGKVEKRSSNAKNGKSPAKKGSAKAKRPIREVPPPSWRRAARRGSLMGAGIFLLFVFVLKGGSESGRLLTATFYSLMFIPLTYWTDRLAYRNYLRRIGAAPADAKTKQ
jgi:hypothetical protein